MLPTLYFKSKDEECRYYYTAIELLHQDIKRKEEEIQYLKQERSSEEKDTVTRHVDSIM
jgi:SMC interacting uncharacterized protein involved in chromosome segregation